MEPVVQWIISGLTGVLLMVGGAFIKFQNDHIRSIDNDLKEFKEYVPEVYARRDDVKDGFDRMYRILERIEGKVDQQKHG